MLFNAESFLMQGTLRKGILPVGTWRKRQRPGIAMYDTTVHTFHGTQAHLPRLPQLRRHALRAADMAGTTHSAVAATAAATANAAPVAAAPTVVPESPPLPPPPPPAVRANGRVELCKRLNKSNVIAWKWAGYVCRSEA